MTSGIHPTALIGEGAEIGDGTTAGPYAVVEPGAVLGRGNALGPHSTIHGSVRMGDGNRVHHGASLGGAPQDLNYGGEPTRLVIGNDNWFGENVTVNRGTVATGETVIGNGNFFMAYAHVGHDCRVGDGVVMANSVPLGGAVQVQDRVTIGGNAAVHQFCRVGELVMIAGLCRVTQDILPFTLVAANNALRGLNRVGLRRAGYARDAVDPLREAYRRFCVGREPLESFLAWLGEFPQEPLLTAWRAFLSEKSSRGYARDRIRGRSEGGADTE